MKKILSLLVVILFAVISAYSQAPASGFSTIFNYQGVARNSVGNVLVNKSISLRLTIHDLNPGGTIVYQETRGVVTNPLGLFNVQVGSIGATNVTGTISGVNWAVNNKYIQVEIDPNGGNAFINIGTAQIAFVPLSLYSSLAGDLLLPFNKTQSNAGTLFTITNSGSGISGSIMGITNSSAANAWGVHGQVNNSSAGGFSTGVLGTNLSTTGLGIGVTGTQNGGGWGVYGTAPNGIGVNGASTSGNGVNGSSVTGVGGRFVTTGTGQALFTTGALRFQGILEGAPNPPNLFKIMAGDATGNASWQHASAIGLVSGSGTLNFVPKWTPNGTTLGNSQIFDDGTQVGIGTITPFARLTVVQNNSGINLGGGAATGSEIKFLNSGTSHMSIYNRGNNALTFAQTSALSQTNTLGTPLMTLTSGGNLGIGTTTPLHTLEVQGIERINATTVQEGGELRFQEGSLFGAPNHWIIDNFQSFAGGNKFRLWNDVGGMNIQMMPGGKTAIGNMIFSDQPRSTLDVEGNLAVGAAYSGTTAAPVNGAIIEGSVGIGITAPLDKLHIAGTVAQVRIEDTDNASTLWLSAPGTGYTGGVGMMTNHDLPLFTNNTDRVVIKAGTGFVGVGTATPISRLHVAGQATIQDGTQGLGKIFIDDGAGVGTGKWSTAAGAGLVSGSGTLNFVPKWTPNGTTLGNSKIFDNGFNVGIGTTIPNWPLHISANIAGMRIQDADNNNSIYLLAPGTGYTGGLGTDENFDIPIYTNNIDRLTVKAGTGHVGIGTTTPITRLHVAGQATIQDGTQGLGKIFVDDGAGVGTGKWSTAAGAGLVSGSGTLNFVPKWTPNGTTLGNSKIFDNGFNVGIGTTIPNWPLHISANIAGMRIQDADNNNSIYLLAPGTGYTGGLGTDENFDIPIYTNNIDRLTVKAGTGHVGIGTTTPITRLHIVGQTTIQDGTQGLGKIFIDDGAGVGTGKWSTASGAGIVSGSGTLNFIPKWTPNGATLGNSQVFDNGIAVGIGTSSPTPAVKLDLEGTFTQLRLFDTDDNSQVWLSAPGTGYTGGVGTTTNHDLPVFTNNLDRLTVKANGDIGVNTSFPFVKFHVNSGNNFNNALLEARDVNNAGPHQYFYSGGEFGIVDYIRTDYIPDATRRGALEVRGVSRLNLSPTGSVNMLTGMTILGNGNVGIGTASPLFKLDVSSTVAVQRLIDTDDGTILGIAAPGTGYTGGVGTVTNHDLAIFSNNIDRVTVLANGDVGVGITTPTNKFEVLQTGTTRAGLFQVNNPASFATALEVNSNGTGLGIHAQSNTPGFCNCGVIDGLGTVLGGNTVYGRATRSGGWGIYGLSDSAAGVAGIGYRAGSVGVYGQGWRGTAGQFIIDNTFSGNTSNALEVSNTQTGKAANFSINNAASTSDVIFATTNGFGNAIETFSDKSTSIVGRTGLNAGYGSAGVLGINNSLGGNGLYGTGNRVDDWGLLAHSDSSIGVYSESYYDRAGYFVNFGLNNTTANTVEIINAGKGHGVYAQTSHYNQLANFYNPASAFKAAGYFNGNAGTGVIGHAAGTFTHTAGGRIGVGVYGVADSAGANFNYGIVGVGRGSVGENAGVVGYVDGASGGTFNAAIYGVAFAGPGTRYAGYFDGNVQVIGNFAATGSKAFKIDHPLDPANKYLSHFAMESPEVQNVYNGNVITDANGKASIKLPDYFSTINKEFKYQLTVVDETQFAMARVSKKINGNNFEIMTSVPNIEVSWQVTAVRDDKAARKFVEPAETLKQDGEKGRYLNPELYGLGKEKGIAGMTGIANLPGHVETSKTEAPVSQASEKILNLQKQALTGKANEQKQNGIEKIAVPVLPKPELLTGKTETTVNATIANDPSQKSKVLASSLKPVEEVQYKTSEVKQATLTEAGMQQQQKITTVEQKTATEEIRNSWNNEGKPADPSVKQLPATLAEDKLPKPEKQPAETKQPQPIQIKESPQPVLHGMPDLKQADMEKAPVQKQEVKQPQPIQIKETPQPVMHGMPDLKQADMEKTPVQKQETKQQTRSQQTPEIQKPVQPGPSKQVSNDALKEKSKTD